MSGQGQLSLEADPGGIYRRREPWEVAKDMMNLARFGNNVIGRETEGIRDICQESDYLLSSRYKPSAVLSQLHTESHSFLQAILLFLLSSLTFQMSQLWLSSIRDQGQ